MERRRGWVEIPSMHTMFNFRWKPTSHGIHWERLGDPLFQKQLVNHFEHHHELTRKSNLFRNLHSFSALNHDNIFAMVPLTFIVEVDRDRMHLLTSVLHQFVTVFHTLHCASGSVGKIAKQVYPKSEAANTEAGGGAENTTATTSDATSSPSFLNKHSKKKAGGASSSKKRAAAGSHYSMSYSPHPIELAILGAGTPSTRSMAPYRTGSGGVTQDKIPSLAKVSIPLPHFTGSNLWLLKPSFLNRGRGIYVVDSIEDMKNRILESINQSFPFARTKTKLPSASMSHFSLLGNASPLRQRLEKKKTKKIHKKDLVASSSKISHLIAEEAQDTDEEVRYPQVEETPLATQISNHALISKSTSSLSHYSAKQEKGLAEVASDKKETSGVLPSLNKESPQKLKNPSTWTPQRTYTFIIQKYIERPLLIWGKRKFDIRVWVLVDQHFNAYFCKEGYLRTASRPFRVSGLDDRFIHLTNNAVQKNAKNYGEYEDGNILSFADFQRYLDYNRIRPGKPFQEELKTKQQSEGSEESGVKDDEKVYSVKEDLVPAMKNIVSKSLLSVRKKLLQSDSRSCFELFGYDFMMDCDFNVWLIEVNTNPCLEDSSVYLSRLLRRMLDDAFKLTVDVCFPRKSSKRTKTAHHYQKQIEQACKAAAHGLNDEVLSEIEEVKREKRRDISLPGIENNDNLWDKVLNLLHPFEEDAKSWHPNKLQPHTVTLQLKEGGRAIKIKGLPSK